MNFQPFFLFYCSWFSCFLWRADINVHVFYCVQICSRRVNVLVILGGMRFFCSFCNGDERDEPTNTKSTPVMSTNSISTEVEVGRSGSDINSQNVSNSSSESSRRNYILSMSERASNLRVFTVSDLRSATKNFSRTFLVGEGGFGCVYKGLIKSAEDPSTKIEVAVKQLSKRGLQASFLSCDIH